MDDPNTLKLTPAPDLKHHHRVLLYGFTVLLIISISIGAGYLLGMKNAQSIQHPIVSPPIVIKPSPTPDQTANWQTYIDSTYGYLVKYPPATAVQESMPSDLKNQFGNPVKQTQITIDQGKSTFHFYWIAVYPSKNATSAAEWVKKYQANGSSITLIDTSLGGLAAMRSTQGETGGIYERQAVYVLKGNYVYSITVSALSVTGQISQEYTNILSTFTFTNQNQPVTITPTCMPRPVCLDATPRCLIAEPIQGWCTK